MLKTLPVAVALAATALPLAAFDLSEVETRTLYDLEGPVAGNRISNEVLAQTPLAAEGIESLKGRTLRTRFWTIEGGGGVVPIHDHANRPAVFTVLSGEIYEYVSGEDERVLHEAGGLALEEGELAHWWLTEGEETVHLIAFDVYQQVRELEGVDVAPTPDPVALDLPEAEGVEHELLGVVDIGAHFEGAFGEGYGLTTYRTTIAPGGIFPTFTEAGEPLQSFVWQGEVTEHRAGVDPTILGEHEGSSLSSGVSAWWQNTGDTPAVLYFGAVEPLSETEGLARTGTLAHGEHRS